MLQNTYKAVYRVMAEASVQELTYSIGSCSLVYGLSAVFL